jgi:D-beta-D-heptose 7-phosphate kinase/D-beta-D-heptose 1-phosphate adenosyltransferase
VSGISAAVDVVRGFPGLRALVVGDAMLDSWLEGDAVRLCAEAPVPVVREASTTYCAGGAANTALNLASLGATVRFVALVGADIAANRLRQTLSAAGVGADDLIEDPAVGTLHKLRVIANGQYVARFDEGNTTQPSNASRSQMARRIAEHFASSDLVIISDYCHGALTEETIALLGDLQAERPSVVVVDSKQVARFARVGATMVTPNLEEAERAVGGNGTPLTGAPRERAEAVGRRLRDLLDAEQIAITLGEDGVLLTGPVGEQSHHPSHPVPRAGDVGAGDTFTAAAAMAMAAGASAAQAVRIGIDASAIAITRSRTATVSMRDLLRRVSLDDAPALLSRKELMAHLEIERFQGKRIVFTNGVFDILHAGHVNLLRRARALGDLLVVGVNSDASTRRLKGPRRPVNREADRLALVSALESVDYAVLFAEDTPAELIRALRPHIHVKGGDYQAGELPEIDAVREVGARVEILPLVAGRSTTRVIDRILASSPASPVDHAP